MISRSQFNFRLPLAMSFMLAMAFACTSGNGNSEKEVSQTDQQSITEPWLFFQEDPEKPHIVLVSGDEEYRSEEAMPQLAKILSKHHGFSCTVLFAQDPEQPGIIDPNHSFNIPGLDRLNSADLMIIFTRFRALPDDQMRFIDDYLKAGKPVFGIRTSTHAFMYEEMEVESNFLHYGNFYEGDDEWQDGFGRLVLGEHWISHHGEHGENSTRGMLAPGAEGHPILSGISDGDIWGPTDVYGVRLPLLGDAQSLVLGQVMDRELPYDENDPLLGMRSSDSNPIDVMMKENEDDEEVEVQVNDPMMPIAWIKSYQIPGGQSGKAFATTIGASTDLLSEGTRRLMVNATYWCLDLEVPERAVVDVVGTYKPTRFAFYEDEYWDEKKLKIESFK